MVDRGESRVPVLFFALTALLHLLGVLSRYDRFFEALPEVVHVGLLCSQLPLLLVEGYFLDRSLRQKKGGFPVWMRIPSGPVRWSLALAVTYIGLFALQTWSVDLGVFDPMPPVGWPDGQRLAWFLGFAVFSTFPAYLFAVQAVVPVLRVAVWPLRRLPTALALALALLTGGGVSLGALLLADARWRGAVPELDGLASALQEEPALGVLLTLAGPALGGAVGFVRGSFRRGRSRE